MERKVTCYRLPDPGVDVMAVDINQIQPEL